MCQTVNPLTFLLMLNSLISLRIKLFSISKKDMDLLRDTEEFIKNHVTT